MFRMVADALFLGEGLRIHYLNLNMYEENRKHGRVILVFFSMLLSHTLVHLVIIPDNFYYILEVRPKAT